jgi:hypothetical protein
MSTPSSGRVADHANGSGREHVPPDITPLESVETRNRSGPARGASQEPPDLERYDSIHRVATLGTARTDGTRN